MTNERYFNFVCRNVEELQQIKAEVKDLAIGSTAYVESENKTFKFCADGVWKELYKIKGGNDTVKEPLKPLHFTGASRGTYDGTVELTIDIPEGGTSEGGSGTTGGKTKEIVLEDESGQNYVCSFRVKNGQLFIDYDLM